MVLTSKKKALTKMVLPSSDSMSPVLDSVRGIVCPLCIEAFLGIERNQQLIQQLPHIFRRISEDCSEQGDKLKEEIKNDPFITFMAMLYFAKRDNLYNSLLSIIAPNTASQQYKEATTEILEKQDELSREFPLLASLIDEWLQKTVQHSISTRKSIQQNHIAPIKAALQKLLSEKDVSTYCEIYTEYEILFEKFKAELTTFLPDLLCKQMVGQRSELALFIDAAQDYFFVLPRVQELIASAKEKLERTVSEILSLRPEQATTMIEQFRQKEMLNKITGPFSKLPEEFHPRLHSLVFDLDGLFENLNKSSPPAPPSAPQDVLIYYTTLLIASSGPHKNSSFEAKLLAAPQIPEKEEPAFATMRMLQKVYNNFSVRPKGPTTDLPELQSALSDLFGLVEAKLRDADATETSPVLATLKQLQQIIPQNNSHLDEERTIALLTHSSFKQLIENLSSAFQELSQPTSLNGANLKGQMMSTLMRCSSILKAALNACANIQYRKNLLDMYRQIRKTLHVQEANIASQPLPS
jgi:hypothetical protein